MIIIQEFFEFDCAAITEISKFRKFSVIRHTYFKAIYRVHLFT